MLLELQNLGKSFGEHEVLKDVNAGVERGDRIGIIGANGTGKTTLDIYATMKLAFAPALDAMQKMDDLQRRLAADPHNATLTE